MSVNYSDISQLVPDIQVRAIEHDSEMRCKELETGKVGLFVGTGDNAGRNVAAFVIIVSLLAGIIIMCVTAWKYKAIDYECWKYLTPLIFGSMGYLFGRSGENSGCLENIQK